MVRPMGQRFAQIMVSSSLVAGFLVPYGGPSAIAQTPEGRVESETPTETPDPESGTTPNDSEASEPPGGTPAEDATPVAASARFTCQLHNGQYTVMYTPENQSAQAYPWAVPDDMGSSWPAQRRCNEISARLESYRPDGLSELQTAIENGYNTVCVTTESAPGCRIVFTVPAGQDPIGTRNQVFENLTLADSGQQTQGVNTFVGGNSTIFEQVVNILSDTTAVGSLQTRQGAINLKPFLSPKDGGTGTRLTGGASTGRGLNPDNFR